MNNRKVEGNLYFGDFPQHGGGGGGNGMTEARLGKVESDVGHIKSTIREIRDDVREMRRDSRTDFRLLFGAIITVALGLAGIMAKGFHWF